MRNGWIVKQPRAHRVGRHVGVVVDQASNDLLSVGRPIGVSARHGAVSVALCRIVSPKAAVARPWIKVAIT